MALRALGVAPAAATDAATKDYVDNTAGVSAATNSALMRRDGSGRAQVADPSVAADIATKNYVDTHSGGTAAPGDQLLLAACFR